MPTPTNSQHTMRTPSHTPGPWYYSDAFKSIEPTFGILSAKTGTPICLTKLAIGHAQNLHSRHTEMAANARLIAAAPELLSALDKLEASCVNLHCALQSTAHMSPADSRIPHITSKVVGDLLVMRDQARLALAKVNV